MVVALRVNMRRSKGAVSESDGAFDANREDLEDLYCSTTLL